MDSFPIFSKDESPYWSDKTFTSGTGQVAYKGPLVIRRIALARPGDYPEGLIVPLGLVYLASYLRKKIPGVEFIVIDAPLEDLNDKEVAEKIRAFKPDLVVP